MKKSNKKSNKSGVNQSHDRLVGKIASLLRIGGDQVSIEIIRLKKTVIDAELFQVFQRIFNKVSITERIYGPQFPSKLSDLFSKPIKFRPSGPLNEVIWSISRSLQFGDEIRTFVDLREQYERAFLLNSKEACEATLNLIEENFGYSFWLIQNRLALAQHFDGIEETRKLARHLEEDTQSNWYVSIILRFISRRIEATGLKAHLEDELKRLSEDIKSPELESYLRAKIFELSTINTKDVAATLLFEGHSCILDYYETLVQILQTASLHESIPPEMISCLEKPLITLLNRTKDKRLCGILRGLGIPPTLQSTHCEDRTAIIESYSKGNYSEVIELSNRYLLEKPDDISLHVIRLRASSYINQPIAFQEGVLKDALEKLQKIIHKSEDSYVAAFHLFTLSERFYGHSWINYLVAVARFELRSERIEFPPHELREVYVRDTYVSPFTTLASNSRAKENILNDVKLKEAYPYTWSVYDTLMTGKASSSYLIDEVRLKKYLAIHHLSFGDPNEALIYFKWLVDNSSKSDRIRYSAGEALSLLKLGKVSDAIDTTVLAYLDNEDVPSILPIKKLTNELSDPARWPSSISTPILFDLYDTYLVGDKFANITYAFEKFQLEHEVNEPSDIIKKFSELPRKFVIAYLNKVWRPEVMKQTILYSGTKEIEETRIKVCQLLSSIDPDNLAAYKEEIKERVKQLQIAKGTSLLEQSKVYVDIEAIKKSLRLKLTDSYSRYKSSLQTLDNSFYQNITDVISSVADQSGVSTPLFLSSYHVASDIEVSEADMQFEAIFSEVTNEFLRGNHGLNAYLSTTVRHGTLKNILRKPVINEGLATSREEGKKTYVRNLFWKEFEENDKNHQAEWGRILKSLDQFALEFDSVIEYITGELIQIKVIHELKGDSSNSNALFEYRSSNLERMFVQQIDKSFLTMDDLINYCVENLWEKTDQNLTNVRRTLDKEIRNQLIHPFDKLTAFLNDLTYVSGVKEILNAVGRAKTQTNTKFNQVVSWFKRSEVYDRQDFSPEYAFDIAVNMVKNTLPSASKWNGVTINTILDGSLMPGRTLDGLVYLFYGLLENAILHSKVDVTELVVEAKLFFNDGVFRATVSNNLILIEDLNSEKVKLDSLRTLIKSDESPRRAQREGRSGLHKIWITINSPIYKEPDLDFYYSGNSSFVVDVGFKLERSDEENINN